jgi:hypothetical protein
VRECWSEGVREWRCGDGRPGSDHLITGMR